MNVFQVGDRVVLQGLQSAHHLNGKHGVVAAPLDDASAGRLIVDLDLIIDRRINAKPTNLVSEEPLPPSADEDRADVDNHCLAADPHGRAASELLESLRYIAGNVFMSDPDITDTSDINRIRESGPQGQQRLMVLTSTGWSYWEGNETDVSFKQRGVYGYLRDEIMSEEAVNQRFAEARNREDLSLQDIEFIDKQEACERLAVSALHDVRAAGGWHIRIHGDFWIVKEDRDDSSGVYCVPDGNKKAVYKILGIRKSLMNIAHQINADHDEDDAVRPCLVKMTLIPWYGRILYDGSVVGTPRVATGALAHKLVASVDDAIQDGRVVERLRQLEIPGATEMSKAGPAAETVSSQDNQNEQQSPATQEEEALVDEIFGYPKLAGGWETVETDFRAKDGIWTFRRMGYTEEENPQHMGLIMLANGKSLGPFNCSALSPSSDDMLKAIRNASRDGFPGALAGGQRPWAVCIDDKDCFQRLKFLFDGRDIRVDYYRPPSKEETDSAAMMGPPGGAPPDCRQM